MAAGIAACARSRAVYGVGRQGTAPVAGNTAVTMSKYELLPTILLTVVAPDILQNPDLKANFKI